MKALTIKNPWAMKIWGGHKTVEQRTWKTDYRGDILITSSSPRVRNCINGHALCVVRLADVVPFGKEHLIPGCFVASNTLPQHLNYAWKRARDLGYAWILEDCRLIKPFPIKGKLNLWNADVEDRLEFFTGTTEDEENEFVKKYVEPLIYSPFTPLLPRSR